MSTPQSKFLIRFDRIWAQARRVQLVQALCWGVLAALGGLALLAAADYSLELSHTFRLLGLSSVGVLSAGTAIALIAGSLHRWRRSATAATIEDVFPQLGQRIRTTVQYGEMSSEEIQHEGVATTLVAALEDDTVQLALPLPLDAVIPWKSLALVSLLASFIGLGLAAASATDWQWRTAAKRTFLTEDSYTNINVEPGNAAVREGESLVVQIEVQGRIGEHLTFRTRRLDEESSEWQERTFAISDAQQRDEHEYVFEVPLDRIRHPLEYRVAAGSNQTEAFQVEVLYPLKIVRIQAEVQAPSYTGIGEVILEGGHVTALEGSQAKIKIELDRQPRAAWLELQPLANRRGEVAPEAEKIPLTIEGAQLVGDLTISRDATYVIVAQGDDGMELPDNKYRIRARRDEPPQVWFESPSEALEVHTLAELLMRIRLSDDFGLARAGLVFEVNNEEEHRLLDEDFVAVIEAADEAEKTGKLSPKTRATLEQVLPLEFFELTQQDSIMYYAFAEDIRPDAPQRTETDLRFVDIRPFRRTYRTLPEGDGTPMGNQGPQLKTLEELVSRQRHALNRTVQIARRFQRSQQPDLAGIDNLIKFEGELAKATRELAEGLLARGIDETELLFQAETAMLSATDSLSAGSYDTAELQMRDALKHLIEGRNRLEVLIRKSKDRQQLAQLRAFDRTQQQKLRRPKSDEEEARRIADRLTELADKEDMLYQIVARTVGGGLQGPLKPEVGQASEQESPQEDPESSDAKGETPPKPPATIQQLEDQQLNVATEARELETALAKLPKATELAKERIASGAKAAEEAAVALAKAANDEAQKSLHEAGGEFRELADQIKALLADEKVEQIAAAQQMAAELARRQDDFADKLANVTEGGGLGQRKNDDEDAPAGLEGEAQRRREQEKNELAAAAAAIAEKAQTLADVLSAAGAAETPEDQATAEQIKALAGSLGLPEATDRMQELPGQFGSGKLEVAKANAGDGAERMEMAAEQLGALQRRIVAPQIDELAKVEAKLAALTADLDEVDTESKVGGWHDDANQLLDDLDQAGINEKVRLDFEEEMKKSGWGNTDQNRLNSWVRIDGRFQAPAAYRIHLAKLQAAVQGRMQELMLGDLLSAGDEPIPPQYQDFVDKYYQVLSRRASPARSAKPQKSNKKQVSESNR